MVFLEIIYLKHSTLSPIYDGSKILLNTNFPTLYIEFLVIVSYSPILHACYHSTLSWLHDVDVGSYYGPVWEEFIQLEIIPFEDFVCSVANT